MPVGTGDRAPPSCQAPDDPQTRFDRAESADKLSAAITADPGAPSAADAALLTTSRQVVAELRAAGWPLPQETWVQDLEAEPQGGGKAVTEAQRAGGDQQMLPLRGQSLPNPPPEQ